MYRKWGERLTWGVGASLTGLKHLNKTIEFSVFPCLPYFLLLCLCLQWSSQNPFKKPQGAHGVFSSVWNHALHFRRPCRSAGKDAWHFSPLSSEGRQERSEILSLTSTFLAQAKNTAFSSFAPVGSTYLKFHPDVQRLFCLFVIGVFSDFLCFLFLLLFFCS